MLIYIACPHEPILHKTTQLTMYIFCHYLTLLGHARPPAPKVCHAINPQYLRDRLPDRDGRIEHPCSRSI